MSYFEANDSDLRAAALMIFDYGSFSADECTVIAAEYTYLERPLPFWEWNFLAR